MNGVRVFGILVFTATVGLLGFLGKSRLSSPESGGEAGLPRGNGIDSPGGSGGVFHDHPFWLEFGKAGTPAEREVELVQLIWRDYLLSVKPGYRRPIADNRDWVVQLGGGNQYGLIFIDPAMPRINMEGELLDVHGQPLVIHPLSSTVIEVRSAGEDRIPYTADDLVSDRPESLALRKEFLRDETPDD